MQAYREPEFSVLSSKASQLGDQKERDRGEEGREHRVMLTLLLLCGRLGFLWHHDAH